MNTIDAFRILGVDEDEDPEIIKKRFRELLWKHHPDQAGNDPEHLNKAQQVILAYSCLKENGVLKEMPGQADFGIRKNEQAFVKRHIFMQETLFGDDITVDTGIYGKYYWDPGMESFILLLKSVSAAAERLMYRYSGDFSDDHAAPAAAKVKLLHLLLQQFIDPYSSIHQIEGVKPGGEPRSHRIPCHAKPETGTSLLKDTFAAGTYPVNRKGNKLLIEDKIRCVISFPDSALYYIVTPMILQGAAEGVFRLTEQAGDRKRRGYLTGELILNQGSCPLGHAVVSEESSCCTLCILA